MSRLNLTLEELFNRMLHQALEPEPELSEEEKEAQKLKEEKFEEMREKYTIDDYADFLEMALYRGDDFSMEKTISLLETLINDLYLVFASEDPDQPVLELREQMLEILFDPLDNAEYEYACSTVNEFIIINQTENQSSSTGVD